MTPTLSTDLTIRIKLGWLASCIAALVAGAIFILTLRFDITTLSERVGNQQSVLSDQTRQFDDIKLQLHDIQYDLQYIKNHK